MAQTCEFCDDDGCPRCDPDNFDDDDSDDTYDEYERERYDDDEDLIDGVGFADPGGRSALRAATRDNPRDQPCPDCGEENVLTRIDVARGYCCDSCADSNEGFGP